MISRFERMSTIEKTPGQCSHCGAPLPASGGVEGFCLGCLLRRGADLARLNDPSTVVDTAGDPSDSAFFRKLPFRAGNYELLELIGHGGMGMVFKARQIGLERLVAIKTMLPERCANKELAHRFLTEAKAAAVLQHPGIVAIHDIGEFEGQPYFSMDLVEGRNLAEAIAAAGEAGLPIPVSVRYVQSIAGAVHYAHSRNVLHRDLKPSNILLGHSDEPKVTDFGLAKRLDDDANITLTGQALGTPYYMPPEQASGRRGETSPASDVYSIGAILFHLLTGKPPFSDQSVFEALSRAWENEAEFPAATAAKIPQDLRTICLKCLRQQPAERYPSAAALAEDLRRFTVGEAILARPEGRAAKIRRMIRRHPVRFVAAVAALVLVPLTLSLWSVKQRSLVSETQAQLERLGTIETDFASGDSARAVARLAAELRKYPDDNATAQRLLAALAGRSFAVPLASWAAHSSEVKALAAGQAPHLLFSAAADGNVVLWDWAQAVKVREWSLGAGRIFQFSPGGTNLAALAEGDRGMVLHLETDQRTEFQFPNVSWVELGHLPDAGLTLVAAAAQTEVRIAAVTGSAERTRVPFPQPVSLATLSPDGKKVVALSESGTDLYWRLLTPADSAASTNGLFEWPLGDQALVLKFTPDSQQLLAGLKEGKAILWDPAGAKRTLWESDYSIAACAFSADGLRVALADFGQKVVILSTLSGQLMIEPIVTGTGCAALQFLDQGQFLAVAARDGSITIYDVRPRGAALPEWNLGAKVDQLSFSADSTELTATGLEAASTWDFQQGKKLREWAAPSPDLGDWPRSPDGQWVLYSDNFQEFWVESVANGQKRFARPITAAPESFASWSGDGEFIITSKDSSLRLWSAARGEPAGPEVRLPDGISSVQPFAAPALFLFGTTSGQMGMVDGLTGQMLSEWLPVSASPPGKDTPKDLYVTAIALSPDRLWVATGRIDGLVRVFPVVRVPAKVPRWLPDLAETMAGLRIAENQELARPTHRTLRDATQKVTGAAESPFWADWLHWLSDSEKSRPAAPNARLSAEAYAAWLATQASTAALEQALARDPGQPGPLRTLSQQLLESPTASVRAHGAFLQAFLKDQAARVRPEP